MEVRVIGARPAVRVDAEAHLLGCGGTSETAQGQRSEHSHTGQVWNSGQ
jgi:hypothetical protein